MDHGLPCANVIEDRYVDIHMMPGEINVYIYISFSMTLEAFDPIRSDPDPIRSDPIPIRCDPIRSRLDPMRSDPIPTSDPPKPPEVPPRRKYRDPRGLGGVPIESL